MTPTSMSFRLLKPCGHFALSSCGLGSCGLALGACQPTRAGSECSRWERATVLHYSSTAERTDGSGGCKLFGWTTCFAYSAHGWGDRQASAQTHESDVSAGGRER